MLLKKSLFAFSIAAMLTTAATAAPEQHLLVAPQCLLGQTNASYQTLASHNNFRLIRMNEAAIQQLSITKHHTKQACGGFVDVSLKWKKQQALHTITPDAFLKNLTTSTKHKTLHTEPQYKIQHEQETLEALKMINPQNMWDNLTTLTSFKDRYANSDNGVKAANWIRDKVTAMAKETGHNDVTVYFVKTGNNYKQPSVVAKLGTSNAPGIVIGGHMDTLNSTWENKPGADDDGSGTVTVLETARTIMASGIKFDKPIYFIWYSAEEMGLVGSGYVVDDFQNKKIPVAAALQLDMTGYAYKNDSTIWLMKDFVNKDLTSFLATLIQTYVKQPINYSQCGYSCSDHASWDDAGIPVAFPFESSMGNDDPYIHTANDKMNVLSLPHMTDFVKLATSYAIELASPAAK